MKSFKDYMILEAFDKAFKYKWIIPEIAKANLPNGNILLITFVKTPNSSVDEYEIEFSVNHDTSVTGEGMQMQIFATVLQVIKDFTNKNNPESYIFSAEKIVKKRQDTRINLYKKLVKKFAPTIGMVYNMENEGYRTIFRLKRK